MQVDFDFFFGDDNKLRICVEVALGEPAKLYGEPGDKEPAGDDEVEILTCYLEDENDGSIIKFAYKGVYYLSPNVSKPISLESAIIERAAIVAEEEQ